LLFDFKNNTEIASRPLSTPQSQLFNVKISPDGKHVISSVYTENAIVDVFNLKTSNIEKIYNIESTYSKWQFSPVDPNMITSVKNKILSVIQCEPYALLRKIEFASDEVFMNIDYFNNEILSINSNQFIIRDFISGNVKKRVGKRTELYYEYENFLLHNHYLISNGVKLKIQ
jgi:WD40 repeat protein